MAAGIAQMASRRRGRMRRRAMSEINVTPFVDVMLVLLVVFMVTAPLLTVGVPVDLPKTKAPALGQDRGPLSVTVSKDGVIYLQKLPVKLDELVPKLTAIAANGYNQRIFVRGDRTVDYGKVMEVMGLLSAAGFTRIGLVTDVARPRAKPPLGPPGELVDPRGSKPRARFAYGVPAVAARAGGGGAVVHLAALCRPARATWCRSICLPSRRRPRRAAAAPPEPQQETLETFEPAAGARWPAAARRIVAGAAPIDVRRREFKIAEPPSAITTIFNALLTS